MSIKPLWNYFSWRCISWILESQRSASKKNPTKNHWLIVIPFINSRWESALTYSKKNLTRLYRPKKIAEIFPGENTFFLSWVRNKLTTMIRLTPPSKIMERRLVFILIAWSIAGYICNKCSEEKMVKRLDEVVGWTIMPYNSWLRKLPSLPSMIPRGKAMTMLSHRISKSCHFPFFTFQKHNIAMTTPISPQINDIPPCQKAKISWGLWR